MANGRAAANGGLTSGALCARAGVSRGALRLYERERLVEAPPRSAAGYRLYPEETLDLIAMIRAAKQLGFSLSEIRDLLDLFERDGWDGPGARATAEARIAEIDAKIVDLQTLRAGLAECLAAAADGGGEACAFAARFARDRAPAARRAEQRNASKRRRMQ